MFVLKKKEKGNWRKSTENETDEMIKAISDTDTMCE